MQELNSKIANRLNFNYLDKTMANDSFSDGFHLSKGISAFADMYKCETESIASSATSKRRIDMLFGDTRSISSEYHISHCKYKIPGQQQKEKSLIEKGALIDDNDDNINDGDHFYQQQHTAQNDIQVQIEKMFSEINSSEQEMEMQQANSGCGSRKIFTIQHLGSIPVPGKILSIDGLQEPLKELFFKYHHQGNKKNSNGIIHIGDKGLQVKYHNSYGSQIEKMYSFSNIAIWASLKFSHRTTSSITATSTTTAANNIQQQYQHEYAFLPIITNYDKSSLYTPLDQHLVHHFVDIDNVPLLAVVMREPDTLTKQLVCHGFICHSSEDAVIMAATLYHVLVSKLGKNRAAKSQIQQRQAAITTTSSNVAVDTSTISSVATSELYCKGEASQNKVADLESDNYTQVEKYPTASVVAAAPPPSLPLIPPPPPTRPPRKLKLSTRQQEFGSHNALGPAASADEQQDMLANNTIPCSGSFSNSNQRGSRYMDAKPLLSATQMGIPKVATTTATSPLGFIEMFNELQSQEGLKSIDDILGVIIRSEGMSFNELKPIYKEFVLKLALVLSKDELYHRSKAIMKSQQKMYNNSSSSSSSHIKNKVITTKAGLKNVFRKPLVKLRMKKKLKDSSGGGVCSLCQKCGTDKVCNDDGTSTDSFMLTDKSKLHEDLLKLQRPQAIAVASLSPSSISKVNRNVASIRQKSLQFRSQPHHVTSTSEDSDYPNVDQRKFKNKLHDDALRPSSSGYFSFSECSYDTESCTCISSDKCYCSLTKNKLAMTRPKSKIKYSTCSGNTIACHKCNTCYFCSKQQQLCHRHQPSLVEKLKQKGFIASESSLSPDDTNKKTFVKDRTNTKLSKSLEYLQSSSNKYQTRMELYDTSSRHKAFGCWRSYKYGIPSYSSQSSRTSQKHSVSSDNLAVDYSMFATSNERMGQEVAIGGGGVFPYRSSKRMSVRKQNVVYAELSRPKLSNHSTSPIDQNYSMSSCLMPPLQMEPAPSMANGVYPPTPMRTCNCTCACRMLAAEQFSTNKSTYGSTPFGGMNMENIFGYFP